MGPGKQYIKKCVEQSRDVVYPHIIRLEVKIPYVFARETTWAIDELKQWKRDFCTMPTTSLPELHKRLTQIVDRLDHISQAYFEVADDSLPRGQHE